MPGASKLAIFMFSTRFSISGIIKVAAHNFMKYKSSHRHILPTLGESKVRKGLWLVLELRSLWHFYVMSGWIRRWHCPKLADLGANQLSGKSIILPLAASTMAKLQRKENIMDHNDSQLLLEQQHRRPSQGSQEFTYETFELQSTLAGLNTSGISLSLPQAIRENNVALVRQYSQMEDVNTLDSNGLSALHHAASSNQTDVVIMLLDSKADINCQGQQFLTPLHIAVR